MKYFLILCSLILGSAPVLAKSITGAPAVAIYNALGAGPVTDLGCTQTIETQQGDHGTKAEALTFEICNGKADGEYGDYLGEKASEIIKALKSAGYNLAGKKQAKSIHIKSVSCDVVGGEEQKGDADGKSESLPPTVNSCTIQK